MKNAPDKEEVENFCRNIYGKEVQHNREAHWIKKQYQQNPSMEWSTVCEKDFVEVLRTTLNWKAPGREPIANFWLKQLTATHQHIAAIFNKLIEEDQIPEWLKAGVNFLIPKNENNEHPKNYRPTTCLPTIYKLITSTIILNSVRQHNHFITQGNYKATCFDYRFVIFRPIFVN